MSTFTLEQRVEQNLAELDDEIFKLLKRAGLLERGKATASLETEWASVFRITDQDRATKALFEKLKLDPKSPVNWRALIDVFAKAYLPVRRRATEWTPEAKIELGLHALQASQLHPEAKRKPIAVTRILLKTVPFKKQYGDLSEERMRELLRDIFGARKPIDETALSRLKDMNPDYFYEKYLKAEKKNEARSRLKKRKGK